MKKQKYKRGYRVKSLKDKVYPAGHEGIVQYTYGQEYGHSGYDSYSLLVLDINGNPCNQVAWYDEEELELVSTDTINGLKLIEEFKYGD